MRLKQRFEKMKQRFILAFPNFGLPKSLCLKIRNPCLNINFFRFRPLPTAEKVKSRGASVSTVFVNTLSDVLTWDI